MTEFEQTALLVGRKLRAAMLAKRVTAQSPITAERMCERLQADAGVRVSTEKMRAMVHWLREKQMMPICSAAGRNPGFWMTDNWQELHKSMRSNFDSRIIEMMKARRAMARVIKHMRDTKPQSDDPQLQLMTTTMDLQKVA